MIWKKDDWTRELEKIVLKHGALSFGAHRYENLDNASDCEPYVPVKFPKGTPESVSQLAIDEMRREAHEIMEIVFQLERSKAD